ncbi:thiolase family protein [Cupriavidus necator]|uniref:propanoyl-CoA C-acyltransferase n=1 Tax=Cupriavidus necator TaxID=106590 RepID=A0A367PHY5_CUPNE|nr:thiolase family protein [Cupriavidus necator]QQX82777.1 thiolase family protein [Cupriavidus necator]RCJ07482.1 thiolase family protein [Cupriavidus necator]
MNKQCAIIGVGMTAFGKFPDKTVRMMAEQAAKAALADAGIQPKDVDQVYFSNAVAGLITGQEMVRGQAALRFLGLSGQPIVNVENACASGSTAFNLAYNAVRSGQAQVALVVGAERMTHEDKRVSFGALAKAVDLEEEQPKHVGSGSGSIFMDIYAEKTRKYMAATGATRQDLAQIVVKSRLAASLNPCAQFRTETTVEEVLASRVISDPLTLQMCSSIGDGAAAVVVCSPEFLKKMTAPRPVWVGGSVMVSGTPDASLDPVALRATFKVYEQAGVDPRDIHVAEVHDASAPSELMYYESLGLCAPGEGVGLLRSGATGLNGKISVNPSGGLLSKGHPIGATGAAQIVELAQQLRGESGVRQRVGAKLALAENGGGQVGLDGAAAVSTILYV